ncbi:MAG: LysR family transcriptional regulator, partial [Lautropia sp.]
MDIRHFRYFVALAQERSFTRAAAKVHVSQSTLSHQIRQLENDLGHQLVDRTESGVFVTAAGTLFLENANKTLEAFDRALTSVRSLPRKLSGQIEVGVTPSINFDLAPQAVAAFIACHPGVRIKIKEHRGEDILEFVRTGELDLGVAYFLGANEELQFEPLFDDELVVLVNRTHPFSKLKRIRMADLHGQEFVMQPKTCTTRAILDLAFAQAGCEPNIAVEMDSLEGIKGLVRKSQIAALSSRLALKATDDILAIPVEGPTPVRVPGLIKRENNTSMQVSAFSEAMRKVVAANL